MNDDALDVIEVPFEDTEIFVPAESSCVFDVPADNEVIDVARGDNAATS